MILSAWIPNLDYNSQRREIPTIIIPCALCTFSLLDFSKSTYPCKFHTHQHLHKKLTAVSFLCAHLINPNAWSREKINAATHVLLEEHHAQELHSESQVNFLINGSILVSCRLLKSCMSKFSVHTFLVDSKGLTENQNFMQTTISAKFTYQARLATKLVGVQHFQTLNTTRQLGKE